ncbi:MAG: hypothetical protein ACOX4O_05345 [Eubacteriales bacterium]
MNASHDSSMWKWCGGISKEGEKLMAPLREHIKAATYGGAVPGV